MIQAKPAQPGLPAATIQTPGLELAPQPGQAAAHCLPPTAQGAVPAVHCALPTGRCPLPTAHCKLLQPALADQPTSQPVLASEHLRGVKLPAVGNPRI